MMPRPDTTFHAGFARYMQVPSFQGISPGAPAAFAGTTGFAGTGTVTPETEDDYECDAGMVHQLTETHHRLGRRIFTNTTIITSILDSSG